MVFMVFSLQFAVYQFYSETMTSKVFTILMKMSSTQKLILVSAIVTS
jgi:hypothetical protein